MLKFVIPGVLALALVVLSWMSLLRVDNMAHDVTVLRQDVDALKKQLGAPATDTSATPPAAEAPPSSTLAPGPTAPAPAATYEATPPRFFSASFAGPQSISLPLPPGTTARAVQVVIVAVEGEGVRPVSLPNPQPSVTLQPGVAQGVPGLCQGPEGAAWVFTLEGATIRVDSRGCTYPVRGLRPLLRISTLR